MLVTRHDMPLSSRVDAVDTMSRVWRSVKLDPSVTMYCSVSTLVLSMVG